MHERRVEDIQLTLITIVAALAFAFIAPFAVARFIQGNYLVGAADTVMIASAAGAAAWAWRRGDTRVPGVVLSVVLAIGAVIVSYSLGLAGLVWVFPLIMAVFHLVPAGPALAITVAAIGAITVREVTAPASIFSAQPYLLSFLAASLTSAIFSFVFARRNRRHKLLLLDWATKDPLTELENRRSLHRELKLAAAARQQLGIEFVLIFLDVDGFKTINDAYGHTEGDRVLRELAELLRASTRGTDRAFRFAGDEFVVLLSNTSVEGARTVCNQLTKRVSAAIKVDGRPITVSVGASLPGPGHEGGNVVPLRRPIPTPGETARRESRGRGCRRAQAVRVLPAAFRAAAPAPLFTSVPWYAPEPETIYSTSALAHRSARSRSPSFRGPSLSTTKKPSGEAMGVPPFFRSTFAIGSAA